MRFLKSTKNRVLIGSLLVLVLAGLVLYLYWPTTKNADSLGEPKGVYGKVLLQEGDCMPSIGEPKNCKTSAVSRIVYFYNPVLPRESIEGIHYKGEDKPVAAAESDEAGNYQIDLPPGQYSVLVEDEGGSFCNTSSATAACPIDVTDAAQEYNVVIDHAVH